jgi:acylphosphatase
MERITAVAKGRVQGVGYRQFVAECVHATGVHGLVQNLPGVLRENEKIGSLFSGRVTRPDRFEEKTGGNVYPPVRSLSPLVIA